MIKIFSKEKCKIGTKTRIEHLLCIQIIYPRNRTEKLQKLRSKYVTTPDSPEKIIMDLAKMKVLKIKYFTVARKRTY